MRSNGWSRPRLAALALVLVQGCVLSPTDMPAPPEPVPIADGSWELVTSTFVGAGRIPGLPRATLSFKNGHLAAFGGCNSANAPGHTLAGRLEVQPLAATRRACPEPLSTFEARYFKLLQAQPSLHIEGDTLILSGAEHNARFRRTTNRPPATTP
jgi:heat shock protein HslJ